MHYNSDSIIHEEIDCEQANEKQLELCVRYVYHWFIFSPSNFLDLFEIFFN